MNLRARPHIRKQSFFSPSFSAPCGRSAKTMQNMCVFAKEHFRVGGLLFPGHTLIKTWMWHPCFILHMEHFYSCVILILQLEACLYEYWEPNVKTCSGKNAFMQGGSQRWGRGGRVHSIVSGNVWAERELMLLEFHIDSCVCGLNMLVARK